MTHLGFRRSGAAALVAVAFLVVGPAA
ncbi:MAG: hypothetical protein JWO68_1022, partial [Actinomycetia bacterium]|nr:hypothetical protein [Actinomycetes bacterium]